MATGVNKGKPLFIPRIPMATASNMFPLIMTRKQFPVTLAFGITANKSEGQTLSRIGIYQNQNFFTQGQLYVT